LYYLLVPLVLTVISAFFVFVSPGLTQGLDIVGGTLIVVQTDRSVDSVVLENALQQRFSLSELKVTATGAGVRIQFKEDPVFLAARTALNESRALLDSDPVTAKQKAIESISELGSWVSPLPDLSSQSPVSAVESASAAVSLAEERFDASLQETVFSSLGLSSENALFQKREVGSALGLAFWQNAVNVVIIGLVLIAIVIFFFFREFFPTLSIVLAAIIDILTALAGMSLLGIPLSLITLPALLMLIGYAVDTEILMSTRLFKKHGGSDEERAWESFKTGITMTATTLGTLAVMLVFSYYSQITVIFEISAVLFFGLVGDVITSWLLNGPMLLWHAKRKHGVVE
jgi:preprotein translocase subunit SecF